jgi:hypothetical protein
VKTSKKILTFVLTAAMMAPLAGVTAFAAEEQAIGGSSTVRQPLVSVVVPTNLDFQLNPYKAGGSTSQVSDINFELINKSDVPVIVEYWLNAIGAEDVSIETANTNIGNTLDQTDKTAIFGVIATTALGGTPTAFGDTTFNAAQTVDYDATKSGTTVIADVDTGKLKTGFLLGSATGAPLDTLAAGNTGLGAFKFYAELETYANWQDGDITVNGVYKLQPYVLTEASIADELDNTQGALQEAPGGAAGTGADSFNMIKSSVIADRNEPKYGFKVLGSYMTAQDYKNKLIYDAYSSSVVNGVGTFKIDKVIASTTIDFDVNKTVTPGEDTATIATLWLWPQANGVGAFDMIPNSTITYNGSTGIATIKPPADWVGVAKGKYTIYIVLDDGATFKLYLDVTTGG